jgi:hypothetical protein
MVMPIGEQIYTLIILSFVVASIAWTVTQEEVFREFHDYCENCSEGAQSIWVRKFFYLFTCEYCFSHWVTAGVLILTGFRLLLDDWRGYFIAFFVLPWLANQWMSLYRHIRVSIKYENTLAKKEQDKVKAAAK